MNKIETFQQFLTTQSSQIMILEFIVGLFFTAVTAVIIGRIYVKYGTSLSNRRMFAKNFMLISMTTMLIITIVKSSLALSLGLVGALSIVRFRAAIKEPEELAYLFLAISVGLGFGANQMLVTIVAVAIICTIIIFRSRYHKVDHNQNLYLTVSSSNIKKVTLDKIISILDQYCYLVDMKRFDENSDVLEVSFMVEFDNLSQLQALRSELRKLNDSIKITFLDNRGVV